MTAIRFKEIMLDKNLAIDTKCNNDDTDKCVTLTINPLHLDEICGSADNNGFGFFYDTESIRNHTMDVDVYIQSKKVLTTAQQTKWAKYLTERDSNNGEPYSWFSITCNDYDHKDGLEKILGLDLFSLSIEDYQDYIA
jgi:hypothetical protein